MTVSAPVATTTSRNSRALPDPMYVDASGLSRRWIRPSRTCDPAVSASAANRARRPVAPEALPLDQTPTSPELPSRSCRYSTSEMSASSVERPDTRRSAERSSRASSPALGMSSAKTSGNSGYVIGSYTWCTAKRGRAPELTLLSTPPFLRYLSAGHQHRRATQVAGRCGYSDGDLAAGDADRQRARRRAAVRQPRNGRSNGSRSARPRFTNTSFMYPHPYGTIDRRGEHFDVDALRKLLAVE